MKTRRKHGNCFDSRGPGQFRAFNMAGRGSYDDSRQVSAAFIIVLCR
jgi:hypothetical protein